MIGERIHPTGSHHGLCEIVVCVSEALGKSRNKAIHFTLSLFPPRLSQLGVRRPQPPQPARDNCALVVRHVVTQVRLHRRFALPGAEHVHGHANFLKESAEVRAVNRETLQKHAAFRVQKNVVCLGGQQVMRLRVKIAHRNDRLAAGLESLNRLADFNGLTRRGACEIFEL